jgi:hypothetical protein
LPTDEKHKIIDVPILPPNFLSPLHVVNGS